MSDAFEKECRELYKEEIEEIDIRSKQIKEKLNNCKKAKYNYGMDNLKLFQLLKLIKKELKLNKKEEGLHVNDFLILFPEVGLKDIKVSRQHVFEALWIIIFKLRLDDLFPQNGERIFYDSIENKNNNPSFNSQKDDIKKHFDTENVNASNKGGIADIYFEDTILKKEVENKKQKETNKISNGYACENKCNYKEKNDGTIRYFYSSKYFSDDKKKGIGSFDIEKIFTEALIKLKLDANTPFKIGVLVKNIDIILKKKSSSSKAAAGLLRSDISYGIGELNIYFQRLTKYLENRDLDEENPFNQSIPFLSEIQPRFHQKFFIEFTNKRIEEHDDYKFIWGAVPRSGKSFMIGGLVAERQPKLALLILGAVSETHDQFRKDVFEKYKRSFNEYNIIDIKFEKRSLDKILNSENSKKKNIIIISQQKLWNKKKGQKESEPIKELVKLLEEAGNDKIIFFDEIHQGSSADAKAQQRILETYIVKPGIELDFPFVMVTATFLKPMLKYNQFGGNKKAIILQWTYDMMQDMKYISDEEIEYKIIEELKEERNNDIGKEKSDMFKRLLEEYKDSGYTLKQLEEQYEKEPELSIICPTLTKKEDEIKYEWLRNETNMRVIFDKEKLKKNETQGIRELLNYIKTSVYGIGKLNGILTDFNVLQRKHTQLWFLPTKLDNKKKTSTNEDIGEVEPMMRYLLRELLNDPFYRKHFCFVLMHSKNITKDTKYDKEYKKILPAAQQEIQEPNKKTIEESIKESNNELCFSTYCLSSKDGDKECLRKEECAAYEKNKSLIILTAGKLRLGISLPCVDIAIHMDPIHSADTIYQSMFRVLTPNPDKKKGYFVDLFKERMIKFLYQYENQLNYNKSNNQPEKKLERLRKLIFSYDLNGISLVENNYNDFINEYTNLVKTLGLENENTFQTKSELYKLNKDTASAIIDEVFDDDEIKNYYKLFNLTNDKLTNVKKTFKKPGNNSTPSSSKNNKDKKEEKKEEEEDKKDKVSIQEKREQVTIYFLNLLALFILFDDKNEDDCIQEDVTTGLERIKEIKPIDSIKAFKELCDIDNDDKDNAVIKCYLSNVIQSDLDKTFDITKRQDIEYILEIFNDRIETFKSITERIEKNNKPELINIYCNIKKSFLMIKEKHHTENINNKPVCSETFIKNEKILEIVRKRLVVRDSEKKQHGEVFTPPELVCEMLDRLPESVWNNKNLKWLDPANGIGNYPLIAYYKLMEGLKKAEPDDKKRRKHIIEKMLYMVELNPINVKLCKKIFKMIDPSATPNIVKANFLTESTKWKKELGHDTFDIIMGNPPYNEGGIRSKKGTDGAKTKTLWPTFINESIKLLTKNGYLLLITPSSWTELVSEISNKMLEYQINYIRSYKVFQAHDLFKKQSGEIPLAYFLLTKAKTKNDTFIWDDNHKDFIKFNIYKNNFIPNFNVSIISKIIKKKSIKKYIFEKSKNMSSALVNKYSDTYKYPIIHYANHEILIKFSKKCGILNKKKILLPNSSMGYPILDKEGIINCEKGDSYNIISNDTAELNKLQKYLLTNLSFLLINSLKTRQKFLSKRIFYILPDVSKLDFEINDKNLYKYFNFDKKDIEAIEKQKISGEGNLTEEQKTKIINFDIKNYITSAQIKSTQESISKHCIKPAKTKKNKSSLSQSKTKKASPKKAASGNVNKKINKTRNHRKKNYRNKTIKKRKNKHRWI